MASDYGVPTVYGGFLQGLAGMQEQEKHDSDMLTAQQARKESDQIMTLRSLLMEDEQRKAQIAKATQEATLQKAQADAAAAAQQAEVEAMNADTQIWVDQGRPLQEKLDQYIQQGKLPKGTLATTVPNPWVPGGKPLLATYNPDLGITQDQAIIFNEPYARAKYGVEGKATAEARGALNKTGFTLTESGQIQPLEGADALPNDGGSTDNIIEYQLALNQGYKGSIKQWLAETKKPLVTVDNTNKFPELPAPIAKRLTDSLTEANSSAQTLATASQIESALNSGEAILGPTADTRAYMYKIGQLLGVSNDKALETTQNLVQGLAKFALNGRAALQGGGAISNYEQQMIEKANSGDVNKMTAPEIRALVAVSKRVADASIANHNTLLETLKKDEARMKEQGMEKGFTWSPYFEVNKNTGATDKNIESLLEKYPPSKK